MTFAPFALKKFARGFPPCSQFLVHSFFSVEVVNNSYVTFAKTTGENINLVKQTYASVKHDDLRL